MKSIFEFFTKQKIGFRFVLFLSVQTLLQKYYFGEGKEFMHVSYNECIFLKMLPEEIQMAKFFR